MDYSPLEVAQLIDAGAVQLVDVRERHEHEAGRISGSRLIELGELAARADTIDNTTPVVFYCRSGARSAMAAAAFTQAGYEAHNLAGGMLDWVAAQLPIEPADGTVA